MEHRFKMDGGGKVTIDASPTKKMSTASEPITIPNVGAARMTFPRNSAKDAFGTTQMHTQLSPNASTEPPRRVFEHQDIIPQALLDNFISMVEPSRAQLIETDISRHCAHNFPAVAFTLGRKNWPQIKNTYVTLANDMQWRVRQTLAFSIHEMAAILGEEYTTTDLLPVFQGFLKDLDEVRIGVLNHLYQFLKILSPTTRKVLLKVLADFLQTDNVKNWRFRYEFTRQCIFLCELYEIDDVNDYIAAIGLTLATDRIADIRREASVLLATILGRFVDAEESMLIEHNPQMMTTTQSFVDDIVKGFALSVRWLRRQTYAIFCEKVLERRIMREQIFANLLLTPLLGLANDRIPNVRYAFVRAIAVCGLDYYTDERLTLVVDTLKRIMTTDEDFDCRNLARQALGIQYEDLVYYADAKPAAADAALSIDVDNCAPPPGSTTTDQHQSTTTPENTIIDTC
jgi:serine/threonine-protein phosphatase 4 regulatory subunit 1